MPVSNPKGKEQEDKLKEDFLHLELVHVTSHTSLAGNLKHDSPNGAGVWPVQVYLGSQEEKEREKGLVRNKLILCHTCIVSHAFSETKMKRSRKKVWVEKSGPDE